MRVTRIGYALGVAAAVAVFAGCSSNGSSLGPVVQGPMGASQSIVRNHPLSVLPSKYLKAFPNGNFHVTGHNWQSVKPNATTTYVIGCQFYSGFCNMYVQGHNTVVGQIFESYVNDICVDKNGNVFIPDGGATTISEYAHGSTTPFKTLAGDGFQPSTCAVDANGTVYVGDIGNASVQVYTGGSTTVTRELSEPNAANGGLVGGVAVDETPSLHNVAVSWLNSSGAGIDEFTHARNSGRHLVTSTASISGVTFDKNENLVYTDLGLAAWVVFNGSACNSKSIPNGGNAVFSALNKPNTHIYTGDVVNSLIVQQSYAFCTGGGAFQKNYTHFTSGDVVEGVVTSPGQTN